MLTSPRVGEVGAGLSGLHALLQRWGTSLPRNDGSRLQNTSKSKHWVPLSGRRGDEGLKSSLVFWTKVLDRNQKEATHQHLRALGEDSQGDPAEASRC